MNPDLFITAPKSGFYIVRAQRDHIRKSVWESSRGRGLREIPKGGGYILSYILSRARKSWFSVHSRGKYGMFCVLENTLGWEDNIERFEVQYTTSKNDQFSCTVSLFIQIQTLWIPFFVPLSSGIYYLADFWGIIFSKKRANKSSSKNIYIYFKADHPYGVLLHV